MTMKEMCRLLGARMPQSEDEEDAIARAVMAIFHEQHIRDLAENPPQRKAEQMSL